MTRETKSAIWSSTTGRQPTSAAPTPAPACAASEIGASITRCGPNRSSSPVVTWKSPPIWAMSSPITNTPGSRSISSCSASFSASDMFSSRSCPAPAPAEPAPALLGGSVESTPPATSGEPSRGQPVGRCVDVLERGVRFGARRGECELDRLLDVLTRLLLDLLEPGGLDYVLLGQVAREAQDRVPSPPGVELVGRAEIGFGRGRVGGDAVALGLDQRGALAGARTGNRS